MIQVISGCSVTNSKAIPGWPVTNSDDTSFFRVSGCPVTSSYNTSLFGCSSGKNEDARKYQRTCHHTSLNIISVVIRKQYRLTKLLNCIKISDIMTNLGGFLPARLDTEFSQG